ncbi:PREDICTED: nucleotide exchange factor SIL1 isoform X2 [Polistes dominula]|nr:PREDICTED: nucleotide exchange factor SIL1 isoform X2 [Polistes dominula]
MQTGIVEAKLMDQEENKEDKDLNDNNISRALMVHPDEVIKSKENDPLIKENVDDKDISTNDIRSVLKIKKSQTTDNISINAKVLLGKNTYKDETKFITNLPTELSTMNKVIESDKKLFDALFTKFEIFKDTMSKSLLLDGDIAIILETLNALEYVIHHIDNGCLFTQMEGLTKIIFPCLNSTYNTIKAEALKLLGAAAQLNPEVQAKVLEKGLIKKVLQLLWTNKNHSVKTRCLYALSALIRNFPEAQKSFLDHGGLQIFVKILIEDDKDFESKIRVMRLVNDLIIERQDIGYSVETEEYNDNVTNKYAMTDFKNRIIIHGYCKNLMDLMIRIFKQELDDPTIIENYELLEIIIENMIRISNICKKEFHKNQNEILETITDLVDFYEDLSKYVDKDSISLINQQIMLVERLMVIIEIPLHDEL